MEAGQAVSSRLGRITISSEAIAQIVAADRGRVLRRRRHEGLAARPVRTCAGRPRGIEISGTSAGVSIALHVVVEHGLNLAEVASTVRNRVAYEVGRMTGLEVAAVEVHVGGREGRHERRDLERVRRLVGAGGRRARGEPAAGSTT